MKVAGSPLFTLCMKHTVSGDRTVTTRLPLLQPWPRGNILQNWRTVQFPKHKLFYEAKMFPFYLSCSPAAMFSYTHCTFHVIYYRLPRESIPQPKKKKPKSLQNMLKAKKDTCSLQGFHERQCNKIRDRKYRNSGICTALNQISLYS